MPEIIAVMVLSGEECIPNTWADRFGWASFCENAGGKGKPKHNEKPQPAPNQPVQVAIHDEKCASFGHVATRGRRDIITRSQAAARRS